MVRLVLAAWALSGVAVEAARARKKFSVDPPEQVDVKDRSQKLLPPKFIAEKYGVAEGDELSEDVAKKIHDESEELGERPPNFFKSGAGEVLLLPEVFSVLDADKVKRDFAASGDAKGAAELRATRMWGRLYVDGWPQTIQFLRAHFGEAPPEGPRRFVLADPVDACAALASDGGAQWAGAVVVARRGTCTFSAKARAAAAAGAAALVLVNNEDGNDHLAGPDAHGIQLSVSMVAKYDGELLLRALARTAAHAAAAAAAAAAATPAATGYLVPIHCAERTEALKGQLGSDLCAPCTEVERALAKRPLESGWLTLLPKSSGDASAAAAQTDPLAAPSLPSRLEFTLATFGVSVDTAAAGGVAVAAPADGCALLDASGGLTFEEHLELTNATAAALLDPATRKRNEARLSGSVYGGKVVVLQRGGCSFIDKAKHAQAAGAAAVVVANSATHLSRFGVEPRWKGLGIHVPVLMVTDLGGALLLGAAANGETVRFTLSAQVTEAAWQEVDALRSGGDDAWRLAGRNATAAGSGGDGVQSAAEVRAVALAGVAAGWPERAAAVGQGFRALGAALRDGAHAEL